MERYFNYSYDYLGDAAVKGGVTITVYDAGTLNLSTIYSDEGITPKSNPFVSDSDGLFYFYAAAGRYDVSFSGTGITTPYTWSAIQLIDSFNVARTDQGNTFVGNQSITGNLSVSGSVTVAGVGIINSSGKIPAISSSYFSSLSGANLTALNASQLTSGTIPSGRLNGTYSDAISFSNPSNNYLGDYVALGATPAGTGLIRLTYNNGVYSTNSGGGDVLLFKLGTSDKLEPYDIYSQDIAPVTDDTYNLGETSKRYRNGHLKDLFLSTVAFGYSGVAGSGAVRLGNGTSYAISFLDGGANLKRIYHAGSSIIVENELGVTGDIHPTSTDTYDLGETSVRWLNIRGQNLYSDEMYLSTTGGGIKVLDVVGLAYYNLIEGDAFDRVVLGTATSQIKVAATVLGTTGGAAAAMGNLPGSGYATGFKGWLPMVASDGTAVIVPCWY